MLLQARGFRWFVALQFRIDNYYNFADNEIADLIPGLSPKRVLLTMDAPFSYIVIVTQSKVTQTYFKLYVTGEKLRWEE